MEPIKTIFFDIDQTLIDGETNYIPQSASLAIQKAQKNGVRVFIASGRPFSNLSLDVLSITNWDGYLCSNGATFYNAERELIHSISFKEKERDALYSLCKKEKISLIYQTPSTMFSVLSYGKDIENAFRFFHSPLPPQKPYEDEEVNMATVYQKSSFDFSVIDQIPGLFAIKGKADYADVIMDSVTKGSGLTLARKLFSLNGSVMAVGDGDNDLEMIESADIGIAMGNATERVKKKATYVTEDLYHDGLYKALEHYSLI